MILAGNKQELEGKRCGLGFRKAWSELAFGFWNAISGVKSFLTTFLITKNFDISHMTVDKRFMGLGAAWNVWYIKINIFESIYTEKFVKIEIFEVPAYEYTAYCLLVCSFAKIATLPTANLYMLYI